MDEQLIVYDYDISAAETKEYDHMLAQKVVQGSDEHWNNLYNTAYNYVVNRVSQIDYNNILNYHDYLDIADEAFATCYAQLERYEGRSRFLTWVGGYAVNIALNRRYRTALRLKRERLFQPANGFQQEFCDPLNIIVRKEQAERLWQAYYSTEPTDRRIIAARVFDRRTFKEIAMLSGFSRTETIRRYRAAIKSIAKMFLEYIGESVIEF